MSKTSGRARGIAVILIAAILTIGASAVFAADPPTPQDIPALGEGQFRERLAGWRHSVAARTAAIRRHLDGWTWLRAFSEAQRAEIGAAMEANEALVADTAKLRQQVFAKMQPVRNGGKELLPDTAAQLREYRSAASAITSELRSSAGDIRAAIRDADLREIVRSKDTEALDALCTEILQILATRNSLLSEMNQICAATLDLLR